MEKFCDAQRRFEAKRLSALDAAELLGMSERSFRRLPLAEGNRDREPSRYLDAMSAYFCTDPYNGWFNTFEPLLNGLGSRYCKGGATPGTAAARRESPSGCRENAGARDSHRAVASRPLPAGAGRRRRSRRC